MISLLAPTAQDERELEIFERTNRAFFESHINARPLAFYEPGGVARAIAAAREDALHDRAYQFLVRNASGCLVARVNLTRVRRAHFHSAEIGCRVGQDHNGKGYASEAVRQALEHAFGPLQLHRIEAVASVNNQASIMVLSRNGFVQFGRSSRSFQLATEWHDMLHFECHRVQQSSKPTPLRGAA